MTKAKVKKTNLIVKNNSTSKVFLLNTKTQLHSEINSFKFQTIILPRKISLFSFVNDETFYEVLNFKENHRSWFLNDAVSSNGKIYFLNKIDPLFIFIQFLEKECHLKAKPIDHVFMDKSSAFLKYFDPQQMRMVADQKGPSDLNAFLYNEEKTLKWLQKKFEILRNQLKLSKIIHCGATSSNFVKSEKIKEEDDVNDDSIKETALGILSEYISQELYEKLEKIYGINQLSEAVKRKSEIAESPTPKKVKIEQESPEADNENQNLNSSVKTEAAKQSTKEIKLAKAAKGTKSISSFFTKK